MSESSEPERRDRSRASRGAWAWTPGLLPPVVTSGAFLLVDGRHLPEIPVDSLLPWLGALAISAVAGFGMVWVRESHQTRRECPQDEQLRQLIRIKEIQAKAATRRFFPSHREPPAHLASGLNKLIEQRIRQPDGDGPE